jgi:amino acid transporter
MQPDPPGGPHPPSEHGLQRRMGLADLVFAQVLIVVGSAWVGLAAGLGRSQTVVWLFSLSVFYAPMAVAVYFLNREMPLEGGLYAWARAAFGDLTGFLVAWNIWMYGLSSIATIFSQLPSEFAYMAGPRFAWLPENHTLVLAVLTVLMALLTYSAIRGLAIGRWLHDVSGAAMILAFALLIVAPFWAMLHHVPVPYHPIAFALPARNLTSLALLGQIVFASSGLEYIAILAGETRAPATAIGRSVLVASPIVATMFILGTGSVLAFHELTGSAINYIAPIPQTLTLAYGSGLGSLLAKFAILLLEIRILGCASLLFTGATRLPMTAGWDHLVPAWFARLHPSLRTPMNSMLVSAALVVVMLLMAFAGVHAAEAFATLNNASSALYGLAYLVMFAIPIAGARVLRDKLPRWVAWLCGLGFLATLFTIVIGAWPFLGVDNPRIFALKFTAAVVLVNAIGYGFYAIRHGRTPSIALRS